MKQVVKKLLIIGTLSCAGSAGAALVDDLSPFVGIDYQQRWMKGHSSWHNVFPESFAGGSVYVGGRWDCFAVELGYDFSGSRRRSRTFGTGETFFNTTIVAGSTVNSTVQLNGGHIDLIGFLPVVDCVELMGVVGLGYLYPRVRVELAGTTVGGTSLSGVTLSGRGSAVARLRFGGNYMFSECVGIRGLIGWESTEYLRVRPGPVLSGFGVSSKVWKSAVTLSAGVFVKF